MIIPTVEMSGVRGEKKKNMHLPHFPAALHCSCGQSALCVPPLTCRSSGGRTLPLCSLTVLRCPPRPPPCYSFPTLYAVWQSLALPEGKNRFSHMSSSVCVMCVSVPPLRSLIVMVRLWMSGDV